MIDIADIARTRPRASPPLLHNGDKLEAIAFLERFEAMPELKKAELIDGIVFMGSPVSARHGKCENVLAGLFWFYSTHVLEVTASNNVTVKLDDETVLQPDLVLYRTDPAGRTRQDGKYLSGAPELVAEISVSSIARDLHMKKEACRRAGVLEYLVWDLEAAVIHWWTLRAGAYDPLPETKGSVASAVFPKLVLNVAALKAGDGPEALKTLQDALGC